MLVSIVTPMYNEEESLDYFLSAVTRVLKQTEHEFELVCINDGSTDGTLSALKQHKSSYPALRVINLSRNFGKESALTAGIELAQGDVVIPMDADLQDPPELILQMLDKHKEGFDVVVAKRANRNSDTQIKRSTASAFYRILAKIASIPIPKNVGDYRLMSRRVVDTLKQLGETQRFMKGIFAWPGYPTATIEYTRTKRVAGESSFNLWSLLKLALEGITSFSVAPLRISFMAGITISTFAFLYAMVVILRTLLWGVDVPGYASIMAVLLFMSGIQFILIGILGEYVGRVYMEVKRRPVYVVEGEY